MENNVAKRALASPAPRVPQLVTAQNSSTENTPSCERLATIGLTALAAASSVTSLIAGVSGFNVAAIRSCSELGCAGQKSLAKSRHGLAAR